MEEASVSTMIITLIIVFFFLFVSPYGLMSDIQYPLLTVFGDLLVCGLLLTRRV